MPLKPALILCLTLLTCQTIRTYAAEPVIPSPKTDIEFARIGDVSLTLDAFVPDGAGPFPTCILVHGGGFVRGDKKSYIKPLFEPLSKAMSWRVRLDPALRRTNQRKSPPYSL
jgi:alpha-L-fucosidase 2